MIDEPSDEGVRVKEPIYNEEGANLQRALELSLKEQGERTQGPARLVVLREPDSGRIQPLLNVQGKGKEKMRTPMPTEAFGHAESPSLDAELALTDSVTESDNEVPKINIGDQDEGHAGPNPGNQDEGQAGPNPIDQDEDQAGSNPSDAAESQPQSSHVVPAGPNLEHMDLEATDASTQQKPEQMDEDFTDQFFVEKPQEEEPGKTNAEAEVLSMVSVPIHQDTSSVPPMTTPVIDLTNSQSDSPLPTSTTTISTITTRPTHPPPPPQPQKSTADLILVKRIGELEQHMTDLIQNNLALEERLDKQGS
ncbi:retrovirus-related pol polyprotein from transposon TNT 1-94 [Tanacetum coccineum]